MSTKSLPRRFMSRGLLVVLVLSVACHDSDAPLAVRFATTTQLSLAPRFVRLGAEVGLPINGIRLTAREAATGAIVGGPLLMTVNPNDAEWQLTLDLQLPNNATTNVVVTMELLHIEGSSESSEWSGTTTFSLSPGQSQQATSVQLYRGPPGNLTITGLRITRPVPQIEEGSSAELTANIEGGSATQVYWSSLNPAIATATTTGTVQGVTPGQVRIVANAGPRADTVAVTITQRIASVRITPDTARLASLGAEIAFQGTALDPRGVAIAGAGLSWSVADPAVAEDLGNGRFRARTTGRTLVTATSQARTSIRSSAMLIVAQQVTSLDLNPANRTLTSIAARQQFTAVARDDRGNPVTAAGFGWSSSNPNVATIDATGVATATGEGTTTIRAGTALNPAVPAVSPADSIFATTTLTVSQSIALVDVRPANDTLFAIGDTVRFSARAVDGAGVVLSGRTFNWTSTNPAVVSVDASGKATARSIGSATIRAETGGVLGSAEIVVAPSLSRVTVSPQNITATALDQTVRFNATPRDRFNNVIPRGLPTWSSSNPAVATITANGFATSHGYGTTSITATIDGVTGYATFTVRRGNSSVTVTPSGATLNIAGDSVQLAATVRDSTGALVLNPVVTWTSFDESIAGVSPTGRVIARNPGTVTILATSGDGSGSAVITVASHAAVASLSIEPERGLVPVGGTLQLTATARDVQNNVIAGRVFTWTSSDTTKATVSSSGVVNGRASGTATITAVTGGNAVSSVITVYAAVASTLNKEAGDTQAGTVGTPLSNPLIVRVSDAFGAPVSGRLVQWVVTGGGGSVNPAATNTDADGFAQTQWTLGPSVGSQTMEARAAGLTGSPAQFTAQATSGAVATVAVAPSARTLAGGESASFTATARDASNNTLDVTFAWTSSDTTIAVVNSAGLATARRAGTATISATSNGKTGSATLTVTIGPAALLLSWSGNGQAATVLTPLHDPAVVQVTDLGGNPVSGIVVQWIVTSGGGSAGAPTATSDANGLAATQWTLGPTVGSQTLEARVSGLTGSPVVFTASASSVGGRTRTWIGGDASGPANWSIAANWSPAGVPIDQDTAFIPASAPNQPAISGNVFIGTLILETGATLNTSGYQINVAGSVNAGGVIGGNGSVLMTGNNVSVRGSFPNLELQGGASTVTGAVTTSGDLSIADGNLTLAGHTVTVQGDFTAGTGTVTMTNAADMLVVAGTAAFYAIDETGKLTNGTITVAGDFNVECYTANDFVSTGTAVVMNGSAPQTLRVDCSGSGSSRLFGLTIATGADVSTNSTLYIANTVTVNGHFTTLSDALVDVAGPAGSVVIASTGILDNHGALTANLPINNTGTVNDHPVTQR